MGFREACRALRPFCSGMLCWDFGEFSECHEYADLQMSATLPARPTKRHEVLKHQRVMMMMDQFMNRLSVGEEKNLEGYQLS